MHMMARIVALHGALWSSDGWYRWAWYIWPASMALLVAGWICMGAPAGAAVAGGTWAKPIPPKTVIQTSKTTTTQQSNSAELEVISCLASRPVSSETACTRAIDGGKLAGQRLAAVYTQRGFLQREKQPDNALADYNAALKVQPDFVTALSNRAWIYMTRGQYDAALQDLNKAVEVSAPSTSAAIARYYRGFTFLRLKNYPLALSDLNEALRLQPNNADYYLARGEVQQALESYDAALRDFDEVSKRAPKDPRGLISRGAVLEAMGKPQEALAALDSAVTRAPENESAVFERDRLRAQSNATDQPKNQGDPPK